MTATETAAEAQPRSNMQRRTLISGAAGIAGTVALTSGVLGNIKPAHAVAGSDAFPNLPARTTPEWHLARRACIAPTPKIAAEIKAMGRAAWLERQFNADSIDNSKVEGMVDKYFPILRCKAGPEVQKITNDKAWEAAPALQRVITLRQLYSERHLLEQMNEFWSDQIYVAAKGDGESTIGMYNEFVLRKHALGKFSNLLSEAIKHTAVIAYLSNDRNKRNAPNENLGRELLELHTVGVGNYTEDDVKNSARILSGTTMDWATITYRYQPWDHYVGPVKVMDFYDDNRNEDEGANLVQRYANYLSHHPATAKRIATRLYRRFISDTPQAALVERLASVYLANDTAIVPVLRELFNSAEFNSSVGLKVRRGQESANGLLRTLAPETWMGPSDTMTSPWGNMNTQLGYIGNAAHRPRWWNYVDGYPDVAKSWMTTNIMLGWWNAAHAMCLGWDREFPLPPLDQTFDIKVGDNVIAAAQKIALAVTGWTWLTQDAYNIARMLKDRDTSILSSKDTVTRHMLQENLRHAVKLAACSPQFLMR